MFHRRALVHTSLARKAIAALFADLIGKADSRPFLGSADNNGFSIDGIKAHRSAFLPRISGSYVDGREGVDLHLTMRPHNEVVIFLVVWGLFLLMASIIILLFSLPSRPARLGILLVPVLLGSLTFYLSYRVFQSDCLWSLQSLEERLAKHRTT